MRDQTKSDALLVLLALTSLAVYILACRPSLSPDGRSVAVPVLDRQAKQSAVLVFDLHTKTFQKVFESPSEAFYACAVQWLPDGKRMILNTPAFIMTLPFGSEGAAKLVAHKEALEIDNLLFAPPIVGHYQFFAAERVPEEKGTSGPMDAKSKEPVLLRVDLWTGETLDAPGEKDCILTGHGNEVFYMRSMGTKGEEAWEIGKLDTETLALRPAMRFPEKEYGELESAPVPNPAGTRMVAPTKFEDAPRILLIRGNAVEKVIPVAEKARQMGIASLEWSADENSLFASYEREVAEKRFDYGILEIPLNGGAMREIRLFTAKKEDDLISLQITITPDGRQLITSSACFDGDEIMPEDRALYFIDLAGANRKVSKAVIPKLSETTSVGKK
jgi:hypothetical protein